MASKVGLSIIIVNYNTRDLLRQCLETLSLEAEIIVVDNASTDGSPEMVEKEFTGVKLIRNQKNVGFAQANNQAFRQARGQNILFLNPDTIVLGQAPLKMVEWLKQHPKAGILGCQILDEDKKVRSSGGFFPNLWRVFWWMSGLDHFPLIARVVGAYHSPVSFFTVKRELDWVQGCALLARKEVIEKIGGFDEKFFMYAEEVDFCLRAKKAGWQIWFTPEIQIIHLGGEKTERPILGEYGSLLYFFKKHFVSWQMPALRLLLKMGAVFRMGFFGIIKRNEKIKKIYQRAYQLAG